MKILVTYYSKSGNTEKIANAIYTELKDEGITLQNVTEMDVSTIESYDLIFIGSPVHAGTYPKHVKPFFKAIPENCKTKFASFYTYGVPIPSFYERYEKKLNKQSTKNGLSLIGIFKCLGEHRALDLLEKVDLAAAEKARVESKDHPNEEDIANAKNFAREIANKCK